MIIRALLKLLATLFEPTINPQSPEAYARRGGSRYLRGNDDGAVSDFTESIRKNPNFFAYFGRGSAYFYKGEYEKAVEDLSVAIKLNPECAEAYYTRSIAYARLDEEDNSINDLMISDQLGLNDKEMRDHAKTCLARYQALQAEQSQE